MAEILKEHLFENFDDGVMYKDDYVKKHKKKHSSVSDKKQKYQPFIKFGNDFELLQIPKITKITDHTGFEVDIKKGEKVGDHDEEIMPLEKTSVSKKHFLRKKYGVKEASNFE